VYTSVDSPWNYGIKFYLSNAHNSCMFFFNWFYSCIAIKKIVSLYSMLISVLVLELLHVRLEGLTDFCWFLRSFMLALPGPLPCRFWLWWCAADVLAVASYGSPCVCRPGWPSASTNNVLCAWNDVEFTPIVAAVNLPWPRCLGEFLVLPVSSTFSMSLYLGLIGMVVW
jgi:hypothetical protein